MGGAAVFATIVVSLLAREGHLLVDTLAMLPPTPYDDVDGPLPVAKLFGW